jgi:type IV secretory pathway TraG/TraD family ATPase VirD4
MKKCISLDFKELCHGKNILFVVTSPVNPASNHFINVFYSDLFKQTFEYAEKLIDGALSRPLHVICDDFATGGQIPNFDQYISIFRAKNISVTLLVQSESQLENMYGEASANCIKNNCDTYVYLGGMDDGTIFSVARKLNKPYDEVMNMPVGRIVLIRRGEKARMTNRYKILENDVYKMISLEYEMNKMRRKKELEKQRVYARTRQSVAAKRNVS